VDRHDELEPEASHLLAKEYVSLSERYRREWLEFERSPGAPLDEKAVQTAAEQAIQKLSMEKRRGPPAETAQRTFAVALGTFFLQFNPTINRLVSGDREKGRFKEFLEAVLPFYRKHADLVGRSASTDWMVRVAAEAFSTRPKGPARGHT